MAAGAVWAMTGNELSTKLLALWQAKQSLVADILAVVREIDGQDVARREGATSLIAWLGGRLCINAGTAKQMIDLARALDTTCPATAQALSAGVINQRQAEVIAKTVTSLAEQGPMLQGEVEKALLADESIALTPAQLAIAADRAISWAAPDLADEVLRKRLEEAEKRAARDRALTLSPFGDGTGRVRVPGILGAEAAEAVTAAMGPLCTPAGKHDTRTAPQRRADALTDVCRLALATDELPDSGGDATKVMVTIRHDELLAAIGHGMLDNGQSLTPQTVRRMACCAGVIAAVLDTPGQVLDLGRERRLFTGAARRALVLRDGGCAFPQCDRPPKWTEGHHILHWILGGRTDLDNGVLLCAHHHRVIHQGEWLVRIAADGLPEFIPPAWLDPLQTPRRNTFHRKR